jgi:hypothetical protein
MAAGRQAVDAADAEGAAAAGRDRAVRVAVRLRPPLRAVWDRDPKGLVTLDPVANNVVAVDAANRLQPAPVFHFDGVFGQAASQGELYDRLVGRCGALVCVHTGSFSFMSLRLPSHADAFHHLSSLHTISQLRRAAGQPVPPGLQRDRDGVRPDRQRQDAHHGAGRCGAARGGAVGGEQEWQLARKVGAVGQQCLIRL